MNEILDFQDSLVTDCWGWGITNFGYPTPQHREQTTRDDILIGTDLLGQLQSQEGERTSFSGVNPEKKTENGKPLEQQIAHCDR